MSTARIAIVGAGIGGLAAAVELAARGCDITVFERAQCPGGKLSTLDIAGLPIDCGPTVLTLRSVFDELFAAAGTSLDSRLQLTRLEVLARHAWSAHERLDLFADPQRSKDAIGVFAGAAEARRYDAFCRHAARIYRTLERSFMWAPKPSAVGLVGRVGLRRFNDLLCIKPFETLWNALGTHFRDPRLRQLFARYSTYCGSSPLASPATLMLIAHAEQQGVWSVQGGMHRLAQVLAELATERGACIRYGNEVSGIEIRGGRAAGLSLSSGERFTADFVVCNADTSALVGGLFGKGVAAALPKCEFGQRSLSAITWSLLAKTSGMPLVRHNVFFCRDYRKEFEQLFARGEFPDDPTIYVCAQDRTDLEAPASGQRERLFCLINAPPFGDAHTVDAGEIERCEDRTFRRLKECGLEVQRQPQQTKVTTPWDFAARYPGTAGALYGRATHGWQASFRRPGTRTRIPRLYLAGGSVHPGPGLPMAALSGRLAAQALLQDLNSIGHCSAVAMPGGMSMP